MSCVNVCAKVLDSFEYDCASKPIGGLEQTIKLINKCDIVLADWTMSRTLTSAACTHKISAYLGEEVDDLNAVAIKSIPGKRLLNASFSASQTDQGTYYTHSVNIFAQSLNEEVLCAIKALGEGAQVVAFVEQKNKGAEGGSAYLVYGFDQGLRLGDFTFDHSENNGGVPIPLTSVDPDLEPYPPMMLEFSTAALTKAFFDSL